MQRSFVWCFVGYVLAKMLSIANIFLLPVFTNSKASPLFVLTVMVITFFCLFCFVKVFVCDHNTHYYTFFWFFVNVYVVLPLMLYFVLLGMLCASRIFYEHIYFSTTSLDFKLAVIQFANEREVYGALLRSVKFEQHNALPGTKL
jgi:hypothetical protein